MARASYIYIVTKHTEPLGRIIGAFTVKREAQKRVATREDRAWLSICSYKDGGDGAIIKHWTASEFLEGYDK